MPRVPYLPDRRRFTVRVPARLLARLDAIAIDRGQDRAELVRMILREWAERQPVTAPPPAHCPERA